jgi:hypothetical protein
MDSLMNHPVEGRIANELWSLTPPQWDDEWRYDDPVLSAVYRRADPATDPEIIDLVIHLHDDAYSCVFDARTIPCGNFFTFCHLGDGPAFV